MKGWQQTYQWFHKHDYLGLFTLGYAITHGKFLGTKIKETSGKIQAQETAKQKVEQQAAKTTELINQLAKRSCKMVNEREGARQGIHHDLKMLQSDRIGIDQRSGKVYRQDSKSHKWNEGTSFVSQSRLEDFIARTTIQKNQEHSAEFQTKLKTLGKLPAKEQREFVETAAANIREKIKFNPELAQKELQLLKEAQAKCNSDTRFLLSSLEQCYLFELNAGNPEKQREVVVRQQQIQSQYLKSATQFAETALRDIDKLPADQRQEKLKVHADILERMTENFSTFAKMLSMSDEKFSSTCEGKWRVPYGSLLAKDASNLPILLRAFVKHIRAGSQEAIDSAKHELGEMRQVCYDRNCSDPLATEILGSLIRHVDPKGTSVVSNRRLGAGGEFQSLLQQAGQDGKRIVQETLARYREYHAQAHPEFLQRFESELERSMNPTVSTPQKTVSQEHTPSVDTVEEMNHGSRTLENCQQWVTDTIEWLKAADPTDITPETLSQIGTNMQELKAEFPELDIGKLQPLLTHSDSKSTTSDVGGHVGLQTLLAEPKIPTEVQGCASKIAAKGTVGVATVLQDQGLMTDVKETLRSAVRSGNLPISAVSASEVQSTARALGKNPSLKPTYTVVGPEKTPGGTGMDALKLHEHFKEDGGVVQVASQFNALESMTTDVAPVEDWIHDHTQGPRASLQSVSAAQHRKVAHEEGKLPDAVQGMLSECKVDDNGKQVGILEKYPNLYKNGYLQLSEIKDLRHLQALQTYIRGNIGKLQILPQWVQCDGTNTKQLQVFCAAPSFQGEHIDWSSTDPRTRALASICEDLVVAQYRATAQLAAIRSKQTGKPVPLHLTQVGQGAFNNPKVVMERAMQAVSEELDGTDVQVYLHAWNQSGQSSWESAMGKQGTTYDVTSPSDFPVE